jgi:hypothetical protein
LAQGDENFNLRTPPLLSVWGGTGSDTACTQIFQEQGKFPTQKKTAIFTHTGWPKRCTTDISSPRKRSVPPPSTYFPTIFPGKVFVDWGNYQSSVVKVKRQRREEVGEEREKLASEKKSIVLRILRTLTFSPKHTYTHVFSR